MQRLSYLARTFSGSGRINAAEGKNSPCHEGTVSEAIKDPLQSRIPMLCLSYPLVDSMQTTQAEVFRKSRSHVGEPYHLPSLRMVSPGAIGQPIRDKIEPLYAPCDADTALRSPGDHAHLAPTRLQGPIRA